MPPEHDAQRYRGLPNRHVQLKNTSGRSVLDILEFGLHFFVQPQSFKESPQGQDQEKDGQKTVSYESVPDHFKDGDGGDSGEQAHNEDNEQNGQEQIELESRTDQDDQNTDQVDQGSPSPRMRRQKRDFDAVFHRAPGPLTTPLILSLDRKSVV